MTVDELIAKLAQYPGDYTVVIDQSFEYEDYKSPRDVWPGEYKLGLCGGKFNARSEGYCDVNSVLLC